MTLYILNAAPLFIFPPDRCILAEWRPVDIATATAILATAAAEGEAIVSAVGHPDTAAVFASILGREVSPNRCSVALNKGDRVLVGQLQGERLPAGATTLPAGAHIDWYLLRSWFQAASGDTIVHNAWDRMLADLPESGEDLETL